MNERKILTFLYTTLLFVCTVFCFPNKFSAQDSTIQQLDLPEFSVSEKLDKMFSKINTHSIDSSILEMNSNNDLSTLLAKNTGITVKPFGVTGLSNVSMRGGNSYHTAVLWNGFNLQDPLTGGYNFASSSSNIIDNVTIQYGGGSAAFGSGAVGGIIHLDNKPAFNKKWFGMASYNTGSFGLNAINTQLGYGVENFSSRLSFFKFSSNNNFEFVNNSKSGSPTEIYNNAMIERFGFLHELYYKLSKTQLLSSQFWYQNNYREIPPNITTTLIENVKENQKDQWYRWALNWNKTGTKLNYEVRSGLFISESNYINSMLDLNANHSSLRNITEALVSSSILRNQEISLGVNNNYTVGTSDNFTNKPTLNTTALYLSHSVKFFNKIRINTSFRDEYYNAEFKPLTYSINGKYNFYRSFSLTASFSKNYRTPTFNDLFWNGGFAKGNMDLKDEYGYSKDIGLEVNHYNKNSILKSNVSFYHNLINNQIQWFPEGQTWTPKNIKQVETIGVEYNLNSKFSLSRNLRLIYNLTYAYTDAQTKEKDISESDEILNKQLTYIPYYQANSLLGVEFKNFSINTSVQYVGYQFTRADNLDWLDSYLLNDFSIYYKMKFQKIGLIFSAKVNNAFDVAYESRQWYPMPGINYELGIKTTIN